MNDQDSKRQAEALAVVSAHFDQCPTKDRIIADVFEAIETNQCPACTAPLFEKLLTRLEAGCFKWNRQQTSSVRQILEG